MNKFVRSLRSVVPVLAIGALASIVPAYAGTISITSNGQIVGLTPMTTFTDYSSLDTPTGGAVVSLAGLTGDTITLTSSGLMCFMSCGSPSYNTPTFIGLIGTSAVTLPAGSGIAQQVSSAIAIPTGTTLDTALLSVVTSTGGLTVGNPDAFLIPGSTGTSFLVTSALASDFLYLGIADTYYADNTADSLAPLQVTINYASAGVPEPGTIGMMLFGLAGMLGYARKRAARS